MILVQHGSEPQGRYCFHPRQRGRDDFAHLDMHAPKTGAVWRPRKCVVNVLHDLASWCSQLQHGTHRIGVHDMKNPGCAVQPGFDYRLRDLTVMNAECVGARSGQTPMSCRAGDYEKVRRLKTGIKLVRPRMIMGASHYRSLKEKADRCGAKRDFPS